MSTGSVPDAAGPATWRQTAAAPDPEPPVLTDPGDPGEPAHHLRHALARHPRQEGGRPAPGKLPPAGAQSQPRLLAPLRLPKGGASEEWQQHQPHHPRPGLSPRARGQSQPGVTQNPSS